MQPAKCGAKFRLVGSWHCNALTDGQRWAAAELHNVTDTADIYICVKVLAVWGKLLESKFLTPIFICEI